MPIYAHVCDNGHAFDLLLRFSELDELQACVCGRPATRVICAPRIFVAPDICYDSPVTGKPITSKQARIEDLARTESVEYDPGMKQDYQRRVQESERQLDKSVDEHVDRAIAQMPARKLERLVAEVASSDLATARVTPPQISHPRIGE